MWDDIFHSDNQCLDEMYRNVSRKSLERCGESLALAETKMYLCSARVILHSDETCDCRPVGIQDSFDTPGFDFQVCFCLGASIGISGYAGRICAALLRVLFF